MPDNSKLVYTSGPGGAKSVEKTATRGRKGKSAGGQGPPRDGVVRVARETKGRKGSGVTLITGVPLTGDDLKDLARELKQKCGTGGTIKNGVIEIQGDQRDDLVDLLSARGWTVKRSGG